MTSRWDEGGTDDVLEAAEAAQRALDRLEQAVDRVAGRDLHDEEIGALEGVLGTLERSEDLVRLALAEDAGVPPEPPRAAEPGSADDEGARTEDAGNVGGIGGWSTRGVGDW